MTAILYSSNDTRLRATGLHTYDEAGVKIYLAAAATVTVTLLDDAGAEIVGEMWPLALTYITGSQGDYQTVLRNELVLTPGQEVTARVVIENGADQYAQLTGRLIVQERRF